jgi:hypothetical protein
MSSCDKCGQEIILVLPELMRRSSDEHIYKDALNITLGGGYGAFIDPGYDLAFTICENCAKEFFKTNPWLITPEIEYLSNEEPSQD